MADTTLLDKTLVGAARELRDASATVLRMIEEGADPRELNDQAARAAGLAGAVVHGAAWAARLERIGKPPPIHDGAPR